MFNEALEVGASWAETVTVTTCPIGGVAGALKTPFASIVPSVALPPSIGSPPTGPTDHVSVLVVPPVSVPLNATVLAVPERLERIQLAGGAPSVGGPELFMHVVEVVVPAAVVVPLMLTTGAGVMVTVDEADNFGS